MIKKAAYFFIAIILFVGIFWLLSQPPKSSNPLDGASGDIYQDYPTYHNPDLVFYWGEGCPHCENVEKWLEDNNSDNQLKINYKEVYQNKTNQTELYDIAKQYCPDIIENGGIGVPIGFDPINNQCIQGDTPIIDFLSSKLTQ